MSICGEIENLEYEIKHLVIKLKEVASRKDALVKTSSSIDLNPDKRNWEYDGYGNRVLKYTGLTVNPISKNPIDKFNGINRLEVIDRNGRSYTNHFVNQTIEVHLQDKGQTMKIFIK